MISALVKWIFSFILKILDIVLGVILNLFPVDFASFETIVTNMSSHLANFWATCMHYFFFVRSMFDINSFEMGLIVELLSVTLLYKPLIIVIKLIIRWIKSLIP